MSPGRAGRLPSRPRPLSSCSARRPRPGLHKWRQARASSPCSAGSPVPGRGHRPSLQSWAGPGSHLPIRVGPPARRPGCCHRRGFRLRPEARTPRPESSGSRVMSGCLSRRHRLPEHAPHSSSRDVGGGCHGAGGDASLQVGGCPGRFCPLAWHRVPSSRL